MILQAVHEQPIIVGPPGQLLAARLSLHTVHQQGVAAVQNYFLIGSVILSMVRRSGSAPLLGGADDLHRAVRVSLVERGIGVAIVQIGRQLFAGDSEPAQAGPWPRPLDNARCEYLPCTAGPALAPR